MNETYMIPAKELSRLMNEYKGRITSDPLLTKASRLAAEQHKLLTNPKIPPGIKQALDKELGSKVSRAIKKTRQKELLNTISTPREPDQDPTFNVLLKKLIKGQIRDQTITAPGTPTTSTTTTTKPKRKKKKRKVKWNSCPSPTGSLTPPPDVPESNERVI